jgi:drug/metabolite transporter (DMT)-like permease
VAILFGLGVALAYGSADFFGGRSSQRSSAGATVVISQLFGLGLGIVVAFAFADEGPGGRDVGLSALAGVVGLTGLGLLYRALAAGQMAVAAPISAVLGALVPFGWGLAHGERPSVVALLGATIAIGAVAVIARPAEALDGERPRGFDATAVATALGAGALLGSAFVCFAETSESSSFWPVVISRVVGVSLLAIVLGAGRRPLLPHPADLRWVALTGVLDAVANVLQLLAVRRGLVTLVAPIAALYPAATVVLARLVLDEPVGRSRLLGLAVALLGLALIALR